MQEGGLFSNIVQIISSGSGKLLSDRSSSLNQFMGDLLQAAPDQSGSRTGVCDREWLTGDLVVDDYHMTTLLSEVDAESQIDQIDTGFQMMASTGFLPDLFGNPRSRSALRGLCRLVLQGMKENPSVWGILYEANGGHCISEIWVQYNTRSKKSLEKTWHLLLLHISCFGGQSHN